MTTDTEALTYDHIVALALEHGFKLKPQFDGRMALHDYVIDFARAVYDIGRAAAKSETADVGEPVVFALMFNDGGKDCIQWPVCSTEEDARNDLMLYGEAVRKDIRIVPLLTADQLATAVTAERGKCAGIVNAIRMECARRNMPESATMLWHAEDAIRAGAKEASDAA